MPPDGPAPPVAKSTPSQDSQQKSTTNTPQKSSTNPPHKAATPVLPTSANVIAPIIPTPAPTATVLGDVVSRDDLLSHLLAMGFAEADCLAAISSCGLNVDMAISWICDRPSPPKTKAPEQKKGVGNSPSAPTPQEWDAQLKLQKDKEHKEEQRRINRAWNARVPQQRAEEERKKVGLSHSSFGEISQAEAERKQQELERQRLHQQQLQQQQYSLHNAYPPVAPGMMQQGPGASYHQTSVPVGPGMMHPGMVPPYGDMYGPPNSQTGIGFGNKPHPYSPSNSAQVDYPRGPLQSGNSGMAYDPSYGVMGTPQVMQSIPPIPPRSRGSSNLESMDGNSFNSTGNSLHHQSPQSNLPRASPSSYSSPQPSHSHYSMPHLSGVSSSNDYHFLSGDQLHSDGTSGNTEDSHYVDGAVHLSAVAKPFVPKYSSPASSSLQIPSLDRSDSSGLPLNATAFSLPPMSLANQRSPETAATNWATSQDSQSSWNPRHSPEISLGGFSGNDQSDPHSSLDHLMNGSLDMLSLDGIVNRMSIPGLDSDLSVDIGESLFGRLTSGNSSSLDRRRNRGLLFQSDSLNYDLDDDPKLGDEDAMMPFNQFLSDVIDSPDMHSSYHPNRLFDRNPS